MSVRIEQIINFYTYSTIGISIVVFCFASVTFYKISKGSKSSFALILNAFTFGYFVVYFLEYFVQSDRKEISVQGYTVSVYFFQFVLAVNYLYFSLSTQSWIFALKYLESAMNFTPENTCLSFNLIRIIKWIGIGLFLISNLVCYLWLAITFPGYVNDGTV